MHKIFPSAKSAIVDKMISLWSLQYITSMIIAGNVLMRSAGAFDEG